MSIQCRPEALLCEPSIDSIGVKFKPHNPMRNIDLTGVESFLQISFLKVIWT